MRALLSALAVIGVVATPAAVSAQSAIERFVLAAGVNFGGSDRAELRYAVSDAERFAGVLTELGGVSAANVILLREPKVGEFVDALGRLSARVADARRAGAAGRTEVLVYYSGHADEKGLLLGDDRYSYQTLRNHLDAMPADVRIAVLDACASGAFTRAKGGRKRPAFIVDQSSNTKGHAFLTSSADTESAQESDRIGASYFTHFLVSGLRGAADINGEGKVTLTEAYQFAFTETLGTTLGTKGGVQHPSYDINMAGTGDVVMTDLRQTTATLVIGEAVDGRTYVRNAKHELVVELYKPAGRKVELGLEPGEYEVHVQRDALAQAATFVLTEGQRVVVEPGQFSPTKPEPTRARGEDPFRYAVTGRNRIELRFGVASNGGGGSANSTPLRSVTADTPVMGGLQYTRYLNEYLALTFGTHLQAVHAGVESGAGWSSVLSEDIIWVPVGLRWNPSSRDAMRKSVKPYLAAGLGPVIGLRSEVTSGAGRRVVGETWQATIGGNLGAGVDVHLARSFTLGLNGGLNWMANFEEPLAGQRNYSGFDFGVSLGWLFGKGSTPRP
jgi:hypothetical protein